ncbi:MAG: Endonuclease III [Candidatus Bathyarchaeota archaeon BA1]|nr:MAG: Endonuclease III [Candidatus Bathyarchaeota archaeon BA1]
MRFEIEVEHFNLDDTFIPSFVSSLYQRVGAGHWVKVAGHLGGQLELRQSQPNVLSIRCEAGLTEAALRRRVTLETGLWQGPYERMVGMLPREVQPKVEALAKTYGGVRLPIVPLDFLYMLVVTALSKRANYEPMVLGWCRKIWKRYDGRIDLIAQLKPEELMDIGTSYQVLQLPKTLGSFMGLSENVEGLPRQVLDWAGPPMAPMEEFVLMLPLELARLTLIRCCWGLGPKAVDSLLLSTSKATHIIPCDIHLFSVVKRLGLGGVEGARMPQKTLCSRFVCDKEASKGLNVPMCPRAENCLKVRLSHFGMLGGWVQTLTYLHGRSYCRTKNPRCERCPLREVCKG